MGTAQRPIVSQYIVLAPLGCWDTFAREFRDSTSTLVVLSAIQGVPPAEGDVDSSRMHHWVGAVLVSKDNSLFGVGYGNFGHKL